MIGLALEPFGLRVPVYVVCCVVALVRLFSVGGADVPVRAALVASVAVAAGAIARPNADSAGRFVAYLVLAFVVDTVLWLAVVDRGFDAAFAAWGLASVAAFAPRQTMRAVIEVVHGADETGPAPTVVQVVLLGVGVVSLFVAIAMAAGGR
jgi:hypothetical protein